MAHATEEQEVDLEAASKRVESILGGAQAGTNASNALDQQQRQRAQRSDAGKPRCYIEIPGVRFDVLLVQGRQAFTAWLDAAMTSDDSDVREMGLSAVEQVLRELERLAAKASK